MLHDHRKPRPHFDLRLEHDGVLVSWAVPRNLPTDPGRNRLAVHVPDHAMDHLGYTDADKSIAGAGVYLEHEWLERKRVVSLAGQTGTATYALIATKDANWICHLLPAGDPRHTAAVAVFAELGQPR